MPTPNPMTVDHLVGILHRSRTPRIVVEGKMDIVIYRRLLERVGIQQIGLLAADNRDKLLQVYERRREFDHIPVIFIADQDMWLFSGIPETYANIIWTQGYSIENDLYVSAELESFLETHQTETHQQILNAVCRWFAFGVEAFLKGDAAYVAEGLDEIVPRGKTELNDEFLKRRGFQFPREALYQQVREAHKLQLRGKLLFQVLIRFLNAPDRELRMRITHQGLFAIALNRPVSNQLFDKLMRKVQENLDKQKRELAAQGSTS